MSNRDGKRVAVTVNDMSEVSIDAALVRDGGGAHLSRTDEKRVEMSNGCIRCTCGRQRSSLWRAAGVSGISRRPMLLLVNLGARMQG